MKTFWPGIIFIFLLIFSSCDILRISRFEVTKWSPGEGYHADPQKIIVFVDFSHEPDRLSVEKNFSLTTEAEQVKGNFLWQGNTLYFLPFISLEINKNYSLNISANANNKKGLSMDREFEGCFTTRLDNIHPKIVSCFPEKEGIMDQNRGCVKILFSYPVSINSLRNNISFSPSVQGAWHLEESGTAAVFTPFEPWSFGKRYEIRISASLTGSNAVNMGNDFYSIFYIGFNQKIPALIGAQRISDNEKQEEIFCELSNEYFENSGWEKNDKLKLLFSAKVDLLSVNSLISVENGPSLVLDIPITNNDEDKLFSEEAVFYFDKIPVYESRFVVRLKRGFKDIYGNESTEDYSFRMFANGINSKPPSLVGIRIPMLPEGIPDEENNLRMKTYGHLQLFDDLPIESEHYPYNIKTATWIECYFDSVPGSSINLFSVMEKFKIETSNNVLNFTPLIVKNDNFTVIEPNPEWEQYTRIEIGGILTNTVNAGIVHFIINQGLLDSKGNVSDKPYRISLLK